jgi:hypothetical protein
VGTNRLQRRPKKNVKRLADVVNEIGDVIHSVGGKTIDAVDTCVEALKSIRRGKIIQMVISRKVPFSYNKYFTLHGESKKRKRDDQT